MPSIPQANVTGGSRYLRELLERYNFDLVKALAAYNAGPSASSSIEECRHFAKPALMWPASSTNTTLRRSPRKKKRNRNRSPLKPRAKPRPAPSGLRNPQPPPLPPNLRVDHPSVDHPHVDPASALIYLHSGGLATQLPAIVWKRGYAPLGRGKPPSPHKGIRSRRNEQN